MSRTASPGARPDRTTSTWTGSWYGRWRRPRSTRSTECREAGRRGHPGYHEPEPLAAQRLLDRRGPRIRPAPRGRAGGRRPRVRGDAGDHGRAAGAPGPGTGGRTGGRAGDRPFPRGRGTGGRVPAVPGVPARRLRAGRAAAGRGTGDERAAAVRRVGGDRGVGHDDRATGPGRVGRRGYL